MTNLSQSRRRFLEKQPIVGSGNWTFDRLLLTQRLYDNEMSSKRLGEVEQM